MSQNLKRVVSLPGAVFLGLGSILGTGVFVSLGLGAGLAGPSLVLALLLAGFLALCNGLSTAQASAAHPRSGGAYEYGYEFVHPHAGYLAGWLFVAAKSASAATAAIGFGAYFLRLFPVNHVMPWHMGLVVTALMVLLTLSGLKRSTLVNTVIVSVTIISLLIYVVSLLPHVKPSEFTPFFQTSDQADSFSFSNFAEAVALMFVAYTGYGRIATLGAEVKDPVSNIPKAIVITLLVSFSLYMSVSFVSIGTVGHEFFYRSTVSGSAPLESIASFHDQTFVANLLSLGAMMALLGVLLNLILGLSRVVYAMGCRQDLPAFTTYVKNHNPVVAIIICGVIIFSLVFMKDVKATWSFSAFMVLCYYAVTNISALRLPKEKRLYPRIFAWLGLMGCLGLSVWVDIQAVTLGLVIMLVAFLWRMVWVRMNSF
jgi:APA family basic amino acid/polyamine antiporter